MKLKIKTFGIARDIMGGKEVEVEMSGNTVNLLRASLMEKYPQLENLRSLFIAVNQNYSEDTTLLVESDEIALIPPVSGG